MKLLKTLSAVSVSALLLSTFGAPPNASAGGAVAGALEPTQLLNFIKLSLADVQQLQQYQTEFNQYTTQLQQFAKAKNDFVQNTRNLTSGNIVPSQIKNDLLGLQNIVKQNNAMSYAMANFDSQFQAKYQQYGYLEPGKSYSDRYAEWSKASLGSTQSALDAAGLQNSQLQSEQGMLDALKNASNTSTGAVQIVQAGNQIAAAQVEQLQKLRQLMMADMQSKAAFQNQQIEHQNEAANSANFFRTGGNAGANASGSTSTAIPR